MDRVWVNWKEFLDRAAAFDRGPGKPVEVWGARAQGVDQLD
jgi:hypothetical protein